MPQFSKARSFASLCLPFFFAPVALVCGPVCAQSVSSRSVDIAVRIFREDSQGAPFVNDRDFQFPDLRRPRVHVERFTGRRNDPPVYALLDFANCANPHPLSTGVSAALDTMFALHWNVSLLLPGGRQTPFFRSRQGLVSSPQLENRSEIGAIDSLDRNVGRHLLFALCTAATGVPHQVIARANEVQAPLFTFRAGAPTESPAYGIPAASIPTPTNATGQPTSHFSLHGSLARSRYFPYLGPLDQPALQDAIRTAQQMSDQFFLIHLQHVSNEPELRLNVRLPGGADTRYKVIANAYSQGATPPRIVLLP